MPVYDTAAAVIKAYLTTDPEDVLDEALQLEDEPLVLSYLAQHRTDVLKISYTMLKGFWDS